MMASTKRWRVLWHQKLQCTLMAKGRAGEQGKELQAVHLQTNLNIRPRKLTRTIPGAQNGHQSVDSDAQHILQSLATFDRASSNAPLTSNAANNNDTQAANNHHFA